MIGLSKRIFWSVLCVSLVASALRMDAQQPAPAAPNLRFDSAPDLLKMPDNLYLGEVAGVATNSRGHIFVYTRTGNQQLIVGGSRAFLHGGSRLFEFDEHGNYI